MSLKTKLMTSLMTMGLVSALVGGATFAYFTDTTTNTNNTFTAGTVEVAAGDISTTQGISIDNLAPGDVVGGSFLVTNNGSLELRYTVTPNKSGAFFDDATVSVGSFDEVLAPGESATVPFTVDYDFDATVQHTSGDLSFQVDAEQTAHNPE